MGFTRLRTLAIVVAVSLGLTSCGVSGPGGSSEPTTTLVVGATWEPPAMDPWRDTQAAIPLVLLYNVYETLVKVDAEGQLKPLLAQAWELSPDRLTYTFHLNPAAKFASGKPVDSAAVVANINRLKSDTTLSKTLAAQVAIVKSATVVNNLEVAITLTRPSTMWLYEMSSTLGMMLDPSFTGDLKSATAGSGPYQFSEHAKGQSVTLTKNPSYWGTPARFDAVEFRYYTDPNAMNATMMAGDLDIISNLQAPDTLSQYSDPSRFTVIDGTTNGEVVLGMNQSVKALSNLKVRQALTQAIDRKALLKTVWNGKGTLIGSMTVPTDPWYTDLSGTNPYNPANAKALLAKAGYGKGLKLRLRVPNVPYAAKSAQFVASQLRDVGVQVKIEELDSQRWYAEVFQQGDYDLTIVAHVEPRDLGKFADPTYYWHYNSPKFQALYAAADAAPGDDAVAKMRGAAAYLAQDCAAIWLFAMPNLVITKNTISGVPTNASSLSFDLTTIASR